MNTPWLEKLNLKEPTTTEEFYNVLKAFKTQDPNGNNKEDEIPLVGSTDGWYTTVHDFLLNSFIFADPQNSYLFMKDGKVTASFVQPEWKETLAYMQRLVKEGLLPIESYTQKKDQVKQLALNEQVGATTAAYQGEFGDTSDFTGKWTKFAALVPLKGPAGVQYGWWNPFFSVPIAYITDKCKYPEVAFRLFDSTLIDDGSTPISEFLYFDGREGEGWRQAKPGELNIMSEQAKMTKTPSEDFLQKLKDGVWYWGQNYPYFNTPENTTLWAYQDANGPMEKLLYNATKKMDPYKPNLNMIIPRMIFSEEESRELADLSTVIGGYVYEMLVNM